jgi:hypothetical protein
MSAVRFELTHSKIPGPKPGPLDHSGKRTVFSKINSVVSVPKYGRLY